MAPAKAPIAPGTPSRATSRQSTLPSFQCDTPDATLVPSSARCTDADAIAGLRPAMSSSDVDVTPKPIPSEPSTSWAAKPTTASRSAPAPSPTTSTGASGAACASGRLASGGSRSAAWRAQA